MLAFAGLFCQYVASRHAAWLLYFSAFFVSMLALNVIYSSMVGLVPDLVSEEETGKANGIAAMLGVMGAVSGFGVYHIFNDVESMYLYYMLLLAATIGITSATAKEASQEGKVYAAVGFDDVRNAFFVSPVEHRDFFWVFISRTLYYMGISSQTFFLYYLKDVIHVDDPQAATSVMAVIGPCCGAISALPMGFISDTLQNGRKIYIYVSCAVMAAGNVALIGATTVKTVYCLSGLIGFANGAYLTMDNSLAVDTLPSKAEAARWMGIWGVGAFIGTAMGPMIGGPVLFYIGHTDTYGEYSIDGYAVLLSLSAVYFCASSFVLKYISAK